MATIAAAAVSRVAYIAESTFNTTPATPTFLPLRVTDAGIRPNKTTKEIQEIAAHRNVAANVNVSQSGSATYKFAMSYATFDDILAAALFSTWSTNVLKIGTTRTSFTFEETHNLNGSSSYHRLSGAMIDSFDLEFTAGDAVHGGFTTKGALLALATSAIASSSYTAANTKVPMATGAGMASLSFAGLTTPLIKKISLSIKNSLRDRQTVDSLYTQAYGEGLCQVTGNVEMYFSSNAHLQAVLDHTAGATLSFTIGTVTTEKYTFSMAGVTLLDGATQVGGTNNDVMISVPFQAVYDSSSATSITVTRAVA